MFKCFAIVLMSLAVASAAAAAAAAGAIAADDVVPEEPLSSTDYEQKIVHEPACLAAGGVCVRRGDCPRGLDAARGLCPASQRRGYSCCHAVPLSERRCAALGGACRPRCGAAVRLTRASDCGAEPCCLLE